jgi:hypothetical protein
MKFRHLIGIAFFAFSIVSGEFSTAQTVSSSADIKKVVTFIFPADPKTGDLLRDKTNNPIPYGTGFFVAVKNDIGNGNYFYLVTAKHVLKDEKGNDFARVYL